MPQGRKGHFGVAKETTFGTYVAPVDYSRIHNESITTAIEEVTPQNILGVFDEGPTYQGLKTHAGDVEFDAHPNFLGWPFLFAIGDVVTTQPATDGATRAYQADATPGPDTFVDETTDFNSAAASDVDVFPATEAVGDYFAIGFTDEFTRFQINTGTAGTVGVVVWEYWNGTTWVALAGIVDGTNSFTTAGLQTVTYTMPTDWQKRVLNATENLFYVRARVTTVYTINPLVTQGFIVTRFQHVFTVRQAEFSAESVLRAFSTEIHRDLGNTFQYSGCNWDVLELSWGIGTKVLTARGTIMSKKFARAAATTPVYETTRPFLWNECLISLPDPTAFNTVQDIRVLIENNVEGIAFIDGTREIARIRPRGSRRITVSGTMLANDAEFTQFDTRGQRFLRAIFTGEALGASNFKLDLEFPLFQYLTYPINIGGPDEIFVGFTGKAVFDAATANTPVRATINNNKAAY